MLFAALVFERNIDNKKCFLILAVLFSAVITVAAESGYKRGDADGGGLDIIDAIKIQRYLGRQAGILGN